MDKIQVSTNFLKHTSGNPLQKFFINNFYHSLISMVKSLRLKKVLDAGSGEGFSLDRLYSHHIGQHFEGVDNSKIAVALGKKLFPNIKLKYGTIYKLPYQDNSFDLVLCTEVLEHLKNPKKGLQEIIRVSRKYILVSVPNEPFFMLSNFLRGKNVKNFGNDPGHINHWTVFSFQGFLKNNNLKITSISFPFPWIMVLLRK